MSTNIEAGRLSAKPVRDRLYAAAQQDLIGVKRYQGARLVKIQMVTYRAGHLSAHICSIETLGRHANLFKFLNSFCFLRVAI